MFTRTWLHVFGAVVILGVLATSSMDAVWNAKRTTYFSFNKPVGLPGVSLAAGSYIFELADTNRLDVVRVMSRDRRHVHLTAFTRPINRPAGETLDQAIVFGEGAPGTPAPINIWYPQGDRTGRQFVY